MTEAGSAILTSISASIARAVAWARETPRSSKTSVELAADAERRIEGRAGVLVDHRERVAVVARAAPRRAAASTSVPATEIPPPVTMPFDGR